MESLSYELVKMEYSGLPLKILHTYSNERYQGCTLHWHEQLEFYYVKSGSVFLLCNGEQRWLKSGDIACVNWCEPHRGARFLNNTEHYVIQIDLQKLINSLKTQKESYYFSPALTFLRKIPRFLGQDKILADYFEELITEYYEKESGYTLKIMSILWNILTYLLRTYMIKDSSHTTEAYSNSSLTIVQQLLLFLTNHYAEKLTLKRISVEMGLSESYMCRIFKENTGFTILGYINEIRCERAADLISNGMPLNEVYTCLGFMDYNYFSRMFRKKIGVSPAHYKKSLLDRQDT